MEGFKAEIYSTRAADSLSPIKDAKSVTVIDPELPAMYEPNEQRPGVRLVRRNIFGRPYIHAEPLDTGSWAFGGRFIYTCDSRLRGINPYPIPLHDRNMDLEVG
jgi:hypothetical protein